MFMFIRRMVDWWNRDRLSAELADELQFHRQMLERDRIAAGDDPAAARAWSARRLGNATAIKERTRDIWNPAWLDHLANDSRLALRVLRRRRTFSVTAITTLAVAIAANTLIFDIVDRVLLQPLPYPHSDELVALFHRDSRRNTNDKATGAELTAWRARHDLFADVGFSWDAQYTLSSAEHPITLRAFQFSSDLFGLLGRPPALGRAFVAGDDAPGADHVAVLSDHLWRTAFGAATGIVGTVMRLDDEPYTVVGVMPATFAHPDATIDLWTPLAFPPGLTTDTSLRVFTVVARLRDGVNVQDVRHRLPTGVAVQTLRDVYVGAARPVIWLLQAAVLLLLIITAANIGNLLVAHATTARHEVALRRALGASTSRLVRQHVTEALVLSLAACAIGLALANAGAAAIPRYAGQLFGAFSPRGGDAVSWFAVGAGVAIAVGTAAVFGALITLNSGSTAATALRRDARSGALGPATARVRGAVISGQVALSLLLLVGSLLLIKSFAKLERRSLGFETGQRLTFLLQPQPNRYPGPRLAMYVDGVLARIRALPGVRFAAATSAIPLSGMDARRRLVGSGTRDSIGESVVHYRVVSPEYFTTLGIPLLHGRSLSPDDRAGTLDVAVINQTLARLRWPGEDALGKTVTIAGGPTRTEARVVGIVGDVRHAGLATDPEPEIYRPIDQAYWPFFGIVVQGATDLRALTKPVQDAVWSLDATQPINGVRPFDDIAAETLALRRVSTLVLSAFAIVAALLSAIGTYGVISYVVALRTREIGVRLALGAAPGAVLREVFGKGARFALAGVVGGMAMSSIAGRYLGTLLFEVVPGDVGVSSVALALTLLVAMAATYFPARRASRIDPALAIRAEG